MFYLAKYNTQTTFVFPMVKRGVVDLAVTADWTPAAADSALTKDSAAGADTTNTVAVVAAGTNTRGYGLWKLTLTAAELSAGEIVVQIVDAATKAVEDQTLIIYTYGNASAKIPFDLSVATQKVDVETIKTNPVVNGGTVTFASNTTVANTTGAVGSVTGAVGSVTGLTAADVAAIKTKTDSLAFTVGGQVDANIQYVNDVAVVGNGAGTPWGP